MNFVAVVAFILIRFSSISGSDCDYSLANVILPTDCPPGYIYLSSAGGCYKAVSDALSWSDASANCQKTPGGSLVSVYNKNIDDAMVTLIHSLTSAQTQNCADSIWTSGQRTTPGDCSTNFAWNPSGGTQVAVSYTRYDKKQPDCWSYGSFSKESCISYNIGGLSPWNDLSCELPRCSLCSWSAGVKYTNFILDADNNVNSLFFDGNQVPSSQLPNALVWASTDNVTMPAATTLIAVNVTNTGGDYGFIASSADKQVITNKSWKCSPTVTSGWSTIGYDDSQWPQAKEIIINGGSPWGLKSDISSTASWIWTNNSADTTIYCRFYLAPVDIVMTADNIINAVYVEGRQISSSQLPNAADYSKTDTFSVPAYSKVIAVKVTNTGGPQGFIASSSNGYVTDNTWKCTTSSGSNWTSAAYDDSTWPSAKKVDINGGSTWPRKNDISSSAYWIWTSAASDLVVYCRFHI